MGLWLFVGFARQQRGHLAVGQEARRPAAGGDARAHGHVEAAVGLHRHTELAGLALYAGIALHLDVAAVERLDAQLGVLVGAGDQAHTGLNHHVAGGHGADVRACVECAGQGVGHALGDHGQALLDQPNAVGSLAGTGLDIRAFGVDDAARGFNAAATGGPAGVDGGAAFQVDDIPRQEHAATDLGHALGADGAAVPHHTALQLVHGLGRQNHQTALGFDHVLVVDQGFPLACLHADVGQFVGGIELQLHHFTGGHGHGAFARHDQALVANLGRDECDVAFELGAQFTFVDHAAGGAVAVEAQLARHEVLVADAVGGCNQAADIDHAAAAKEHAVAVADDDLAGCRDAAEDGAGLGAEHAVEGGRAAAGLVEVHMGTRTDVEALPVDHSALRALVDHHVGAAGADAGLTRGYLAASGQGLCGGVVRRQHPKPDGQAHRQQMQSAAESAAGTAGGGARALCFTLARDELGHHHHVAVDVAPNDSAGFVHVRTIGSR